jgi:ATP-dependent DNA helicase PIF1
MADSTSLLPAAATTTSSTNSTTTSILGSSSYYAVQRGRIPGVYMTWGECEEQTKGFGGSCLRKCKTREEAAAFVAAAAASVPPSTPPSDGDDREGQKASAGREHKAENVAELNEKQREALEHVKVGHNVFITGQAGTGKSRVIGSIRAFAREKYRGLKGAWCAVAPTGTAAILVEGQTIHSFAGIGVPTTKKDFEKAWGRKKEWRRLQLLVVDEVSMISGEFWDYLSGVVSEIRSDPRPFGGVQLVVCGDFLQLPPIEARESELEDSRRALEAQPDGGKDVILHRNLGFAFQSKAWQEATFQTIMLEEIFRQESREFATMLGHIRLGRVPGTALRFLESCVRPLPIDPRGILPTVLHCMNRDVQSHNNRELSQLPGELHHFEAVDRTETELGAPPWAKKKLDTNGFFRNCPAQQTLDLKVGAQVMLVKNDTGPAVPRGEKLVNGSRGVVTGFREASQEDLERVLRGLLGLGDLEAVSQPILDQAKRAMGAGSRGSVCQPIVAFKTSRGKHVERTLDLERFQCSVVGLGCCERFAVPLKLAWSFTIHKSQGLSIDSVIVDLTPKMFADGQAYVALSRARSQTGLQIRGFTREKVRCSSRARDFYESGKPGFAGWWESASLHI